MVLTTDPSLALSDSVCWTPFSKDQGCTIGEARLGTLAVMVQERMQGGAGWVGGFEPVKALIRGLPLLLVPPAYRVCEGIVPAEQRVGVLQTTTKGQTWPEAGTGCPL